LWLKTRNLAAPQAVKRSMCLRGPKKVDATWLFQAVALLVAFCSAKATDYYVDPSSNSAYATVQSAVDAVSGQSEFNRANIFITPGAYNEMVTVSQPFISLIGLGDSREATKISFSGTVSRSGSQFGWGATIEIRDTATAFMARNLTFENSTADKNVSSALAARSAADRVIFDGVRFLGYQDTLMVDEMSRQYFRDSFVTGDTDFIFGDATAVFDRCTIESTDYGWITAANTKRITANGLVFLDCSLTAGADRNPATDDRTAAQPGTVFLGRPWLWNEPDINSSVIFIRTTMGRHITASGWDPWDLPNVSSNVNRDPHTRYSEFGGMDSSGNPLTDSNGDGTPNGRVSWADPMTEEQAGNYTLDHIFGPVDFWNATTQAETSGAVYESQGEPWNAMAQLALLPSEPGVPSQALNISTRLGVQTGDNVLIAGFILTGTAPTKVLVRALGPSLEQANIEDALEDPVLDLRAADGTRVAFNNNWKYSQEAEISATGIPPSNDHEAAILATLAPGAYTAIVKGRASTSGVALVEVYGLSGTDAAELANISTRGFIDGGDHVMIAGFILAGGSGGSRVMIRAIGPTLSAAGIAGALADPTLELHDGNGISIAFNDNWKDAQQTEIAATKISPGDERESAIVASLPPGSYTAVLASRDGGTGIGVIEVYNLGR
jgi:hypothetical protein